MGLFVFGAFCALMSGQLQGQIAIDPGVIPGPVVDTPTVVDNNTVAGGATVGGDGDPVDIEDAASLDFGGSDEDNRNQGFVGATADRVTQNTFVGAASQTFGSLAADGTFGGGVNDTTTIRVPGGGGGGAAVGAGGGQGGAGGFTGTSGGSVIRSSIRTRLRPAFAAPVVPPQATEFAFNDNLARQPAAQSLVGRYQVFIENKTATIMGLVNSQADADQLIRQLRLQPGVYNIVNELQIVR